MKNGRNVRKTKNEIEEAAMIKLAVFDVDGTLVTKGNRRVPASCVKALNEGSEVGNRQWQTSFCYGTESAGAGEL